jgi:regulator of protease activity HflC (stomatin/prohibitin superfamily)
MDMTLVALCLTLTVFLCAMGFRKVADDLVVPVRRFGEFHRALGPGWHWIWPWLDRPGAGVALIGHRVVAHHRATGITHAEVFFQILDPHRTGRNIEQVDAIVSQTATDQLAGLEGAKEAVALWLKAGLNESLQEIGLRVTRCQLQ